MQVSRIACTFPGKFGDLLWALPTVRAISETYDQPVNLILSDYLAPMVDLMNEQPYIQQAVSYPVWQIELSAPVSPRVPPSEFNFDRIFHLGLRGWPTLSLPREILGLAEKQTPIKPETFDLGRPWITVQGAAHPVGLVVGFTDEHFELKVGLTTLLQIDERWAGCVIAPQGSRWATERPVGGYPLHECGWLEAARLIRNADKFLGCCSALHVLSIAMGKPTVVMEPNEHRWHPIFWPNEVGDRVHLVLGNDNRPTFDARAVRQAIEKFL